MGIYGHQFDSYMIDNLTIDEVAAIICNCNRALVEYYQDIEFATEESLNEGANLEVRKIFKQYKKDVKDLKKKYKKDYKTNKEEAINDLDAMNKIIDKAIKDIKKVNADSVVSTILGDIYSIVCDIILFAASVKIGTSVGRSAGAFTNNSTIGLTVSMVTAGTGGGITGGKIGKQLQSLEQNYKKVKEKKISVAEYLNLYRGEIIQTLEMTKAWNNGLKVGIKEEIKKEKED